MKKGFLFLFLLSMSTLVWAQKGFLRGKVLDGDYAEGLIGATVSKQGTTIGTVTDFDGNYSLNLDAGVHTIVFQFVSYQTQTISDVVITAGEVTKLDITMNSESTDLEEVVVTAEQIRDNDIAILNVQKKSANLVDGISSQTFRKVGDSNLGGAMKRVTGVSVQDGKYVYVRGLGDRYTKTTVNGMAIPGLDPDKNAVQIDIFPTSTIENVVVYKTFSPDLMGDFTGGIVDIETKNFPEEKTTSVSGGIGFNPDMHLRNNAVTYEGGSTDFLGYDDGTRELPFAKTLNMPNVLAADGAVVEGYTRAFNPTLGAKTASNFMNYNLSLTHGNQINKDKVTFGYNAILNYRKTEEFFEEVEYGQTTKDTESSISQLQLEEKRTLAIGNSEVMWNALLSGAMKFNSHSFSASLMHMQNGVSSAAQGNKANYDDNPSVLKRDVLTYTQRAVTTGIFIGKHNFNKFSLQWKGATNVSRIYEPDFRVTDIQIKEDGTYDLNTGVGAGVNRFFRDLSENNNSFKIDVTYPFGEKNKLKFGGFGQIKSRNFEVIEYKLRTRGGVAISGDPNDLLLPENIWNPTTDEGTYVRGDGLIPSKTFYAKQNLFAGYVMSEMNISPKLRAIYGVRAEKVDMFYTGENQDGDNFDSENTLDELNILPSVNLVYALNEEMNLRSSFNSTLARPSFKEKSNAQIYDPISDLTFIGNIDLEQTYVNNYDVRWEYFYGRGEMASVSGFYKQFDGHIELTSYDTAPDQITPRNAGPSTVVGVEVEFRKNITNNLSFGTNASFIKSAVDMREVFVNDDDGTEYALRQKYLRDGESQSTSRNMAGQAPYLVNAFFNITDNKNTFNANIAYNVQGETLSIVGSGLFPDVYVKPFHSLNMNVYKDFGANQNSRVTFGVNNILKSQNRSFFKSYGDESVNYALRQPGRTFTLKYSYTF